MSGGDVTYFNGKRVGATETQAGEGGAPPARPKPLRRGEGPHLARIYTLPPDVLRAGRNVLAVRVFDGRGKGCFVGEAEEMTLRVRGRPEGQGLYFPGRR